MTRIRLLLATMSLFCCATVVSAKMTVSSGEVVPGEWNSNFSRAKKIAEDNQIPLLVFWASPGCGWCGFLEKACQTKTFLAWQAQRGLIMVFCKGTSGDNGVCKSFVQNSSGAFPYVGVYWRKKSGTILKKFTGRNTYLPVQTYENLEDNFIASIDGILTGWEGGSGHYETVPGPVASKTNEWSQKKVTMTLPLYQQAEGVTTMRGVLDFAMTSRGKVSAKYRNSISTRTVSLSGKWEVDSEGMAKLSCNKKNVSLSGEISSDGKLSVLLDDPSNKFKLFSGETEIYEGGFKDWEGLYTLALSDEENSSSETFMSGVALATIKVTSSSNKGTAKCSIVYPDGKKDSVSVSLQKKGAFALLPLLKCKSVNAVSAAVKIRRRASSAPTPRAIISDEGVVSYLSHEGSFFNDLRACTCFGSFIRKNELTEDVFDSPFVGVVYDLASLGTISDYGLVKSAVGQDAILQCRAKKLVLAQKTPGFSLTYKSSTGAFTGKTRVEFEDGRPAANFSGVVLPGWGTGLVDEEVPDFQGAPQGLGSVWFKDRVGKKSIVRGFPVGLYSSDGK